MCSKCMGFYVRQFNQVFNSQILFNFPSAEKIPYIESFLDENLSGELIATQMLGKIGSLNSFTENKTF